MVFVFIMLVLIRYNINDSLDQDFRGFFYI